jgi:hypothetical protein
MDQEIPVSQLLAETTLPPAGELQTLSTAILLDRLRFATQAGITFEGARDTYALFGYPRTITSKMYRDQYERGGISKRIVEAYPKATWRGGLELYEDEDPDKETPFELAWKTLERKHKIWLRLQQADILAGLSTYSVLLIGATGGLETELPKVSSPDKLLYLAPFSGGGGPAPSGQQVSEANYIDATIDSYETSPSSPRFGYPKAYRLRRTDSSDPALQRPVHWSRIIHVAEGTLNDDVFGQPTLRNVWNLLMDLEKVTGGGSEAFFIRANAGMQINVDKDMQIPPTPGELDKLRDDVEAYKHNITRILRTRGVEINQLGSDVANFSNPADAIMKQIAGSKGIPMRILTGSEMGQLASGQDADNWNTQVQDRRTGYAGPLIVQQLVDRLIEYGYLPTPAQYEVGWPTEEDMSDPEKASLAVSLASVNKAQGSIVFTDEEIRDKTFDMKPLTPAEKQKAAEEQGALAQAKNPIPDPVPGQSAAPVKKGPFGRPVAAEEANDELLMVLEAAIEANATEVIDQILGLKREPTA